MSLERQVVLAGALLGDRVDLRLRGVDDLVDVAVGRVAHLGDAGAGLHQAPQDRALVHDLGVVLGVGRRGDRVDQGVQIGGAADPGDLAALGQLGGERDRVGRLTAGVEVEDRVVDRLVGRAVEVLALDDLDDVGDGVLRQQHAAEHRLLGVEVLRGDPFEAALGPVAPVPAGVAPVVAATVPSAVPVLVAVGTAALATAVAGRRQPVSGARSAVAARVVGNGGSIGGASPQWSSAGSGWLTPVTSSRSSQTPAVPLFLRHGSDKRRHPAPLRARRFAGP